jgi:hypothetical protein
MGRSPVVVLVIVNMLNILQGYIYNSSHLLTLVRGWGICSVMAGSASAVSILESGS